MIQFDKQKFEKDTVHLLNLLEKPDWPEAAPDFLICNDTEEDKTERAQNILDYIKFDITGKKFCDFGCGEGHLAIQASKKASLSVGYDIAKTGALEWENESTCFLSNDLDKIISKGPFDYVVLYDVLDHCINPIDALMNVLKICHAKTEIFVRCHPWTSRHAGHLYKQLNKAYIHLIFTQEELQKMGLKTEEYHNKYFYPLATHKFWFDSCNMVRTDQEVIKSPVEKFFRRPLITARLPLDQYRGEFPEFQMSQIYIDYYLSVEKCF